MIHIETLSQDWILSVKAKIARSDPGILERLLRAYYLTEQLVEHGLEFVFKGGTCLTLLTQQPRRFSTDVDVITGMGKDEIESVLDKICSSSSFTRYELDVRRSYQSEIPKAHYFLFFVSAIDGKEISILLDLLFEENEYSSTQETPIVNEYIKLDGGASTVLTPTINAIMGDKLTAFAPNTTGILYGTRKDLEIVKQLFDLDILFDEMDDFGEVVKSFNACVKNELQYRSALSATKEDVLMDMISTAELIAKRNSQDSASDNDKFAEIQNGLKRFNYYTINRPFRIEQAIVASAKVAVVAAKILKGDHTPLLRVPNGVQRSDYLIPFEITRYAYLNRKLRSVATDAQFYWHTALKILDELE